MSCLSKYLYLLLRVTGPHKNKCKLHEKSLFWLMWLTLKSQGSKSEAIQGFRGLPQLHLPLLLYELWLCWIFTGFQVTFAYATASFSGQDGCCLSKILNFFPLITLSSSKVWMYWYLPFTPLDTHFFLKCLNPI